MNIVQNGAQLPVGSRLAHFAKNWEEISSDPCFLETIQAYQVEFYTILQQVGCLYEIQFDATQSQALTKGGGRACQERSHSNTSIRRYRVYESCS